MGNAVMPCLISTVVRLELDGAINTAASVVASVKEHLLMFGPFSHLVCD
jgi:hypothetical protein